MIDFGALLSLCWLFGTKSDGLRSAGGEARKEDGIGPATLPSKGKPMRLKEILDAKGGDILTIERTASLADVVRKMCDYNCGSLVVCEAGRLTGIISERDILRAIAELDAPLETILVEARMTRDVVTGSPEDNISDTMGVMTRSRIRHLPVLVDDSLVGLISIGDIVKAQHQKLERENHLLMSYIQS
jgi:CBS domain-containing protein